MKEEMKGLYAAIVLSLAVILITNWIFPSKNTEQITKAPEKETPALTETVKDKTDDKIFSPEKALIQDSRIKIKNNSLTGSIRIKGARFDNLNLAKYKQTLKENSADVELLMPAQTSTPYYAEFGWLSSDNSVKLPKENTLWSAKGSELTSEKPLVLEWNNGQGLKFIRKISLDDNYMFTIEQIVENNSNKEITLYPYGLISRKPQQSENSVKVVHQGIAGVIDSTLKEVKLEDLDEDKNQKYETNGGWIGFSDHYWLGALVLNNNTKSKIKFAQTAENTYQTDFVGEPLIIGAGDAVAYTNRFFAGAKEIKLLDEYTKNLNIDKFDLAVDFGWYYFLTKPFFYILDFLFEIIGNMGWAILLFAALLRLAMFPIANKSFESMSKMKKMQPKIQELQEKFKDDKVKLQSEMMNLYKKEKINPASGCLPMLIQIPVFFSLYKVLNIAIEIRHAPFVGWIKDLSAPDPMTISAITHIPLPTFLDIGVWPILMGITMYIQQKLNPAPANKDQARMFALMPLVFMFMLGHFASGLVIYWTLSNVLSIVQQRVIMKKIGVK
ncbi:MAG: membrane protein insertase YidC [Alphaproteobacteria bacterium]|nr:membrane protein insertase YidC [Alphaproteobacteria bacterium]